jgi:hypothetical protein
MPSSDDSDEAWDDIESEEEEEEESSDAPSSPSVHTSDAEDEAVDAPPGKYDVGDDGTPVPVPVKRVREVDSDSDDDFVPAPPAVKAPRVEPSEGEDVALWRHIVTVVNLLVIEPHAAATKAYSEYMAQPLNKQFLPQVNGVLNDVETAGEEFMKKFEGTTAAVMAAALQHHKVSNIHVEGVKEATSETCMLTRAKVALRQLRRCKCWNSMHEGAEPVVTFYVHQKLVPLVFTLHTLFNLNERIAAFSRVHCCLKKGKDLRVTVANMDVLKIVKSGGQRAVASTFENEVSGRTKALTCVALSTLRSLTERGPTKTVASMKLAAIA